MFNLTYQGKSFNQRESDNYVNLGQLCSTHGKKLQNWTINKSAILYTDAVSANTGIPALELIVTKQGNEGTWGHPLIAIEVARWISPDFGVWCNQHIKQLIETGSTTIPQQPKLSPEDKATKVSSAVTQIYDQLGDRNPRLAQILVDHAISDIVSVQSNQSNKQLSGTSSSGKVLKGVVEIALDLGYQTDHKNRGQLGKFVKNCVDSKRIYHEERLVNGLMQKVCCYEYDDREVKKAIIAFFER